jgi:hypothetical protein
MANYIRGERIYIRRRTYWPNPFIPRLKAARFEWSKCRTWSFNSAFSAALQPSSLFPWGSTAYRDSLSVDEIVVVCVNRGLTAISSAFSTSSAVSGGLALGGRLGIPPGGRLRLYVGLRLSQWPRSGMKREFWTLVRVESVATSGSGCIVSDCFDIISGQERHTDGIQDIDEVTVVLLASQIYLHTGIVALSGRVPLASKDRSCCYTGPPHHTILGLLWHGKRLGVLTPILRRRLFPQRGERLYCACSCESRVLVEREVELRSLWHGTTSSPICLYFIFANSLCGWIQWMRGHLLQRDEL